MIHRFIDLTVVTSNTGSEVTTVLTAAQSFCSVAISFRSTSERWLRWKKKTRFNRIRQVWFRCRIQKNLDVFFAECTYHRLLTIRKESYSAKTDLSQSLYDFPIFFIRSPWRVKNEFRFLILSKTLDDRNVLPFLSGLYGEFESVFRIISHNAVWFGRGLRL